MNISELLVLYILFRLKHFACDFILQSNRMALTKGMPGRDGYTALFAHAGIHAGATLILVLFFAPALWWLGPLDFVVHGLIDRVKAGVTFQKGWTAKDKMFWWSFGMDQEAHNYTHLVYIIVIYLYLTGQAAV